MREEKWSKYYIKERDLFWKFDWRRLMNNGGILINLGLAWDLSRTRFLISTLFRVLKNEEMID